MMLRLMALLVCCFALATPAFAQNARIALVIGVGNYTAVTKLRNPPRDARAVAAKLRDLGFQTDLLIDPDRAALERAIRALGDKAGSADVALFYYAGHALEAGGQNYLVPATANVQSARDIPFETVELNLVLAQLESRARTVLLFLDACRENPFASRIATGARGLVSRGLAASSANAMGTMVVYATAPGQTADDGAGEDSLFTTALLRHIDTPGLEVRQMLSRVRRDVRDATKGAQIPWESSALEGDFYFHPAPTTNPAPLPSEAAIMPQLVTPPSKECEIPHFGGMRTGGALALLRVVNNGKRCGAHLFANRQRKIPFESLSLQQGPSHGVVTIEGNSFYYIPANKFAGSDSFKIVSLPSGSVTVAVTVFPPEALQQ
jgi:Caspase domain